MKMLTLSQVLLASFFAVSGLAGCGATTSETLGSQSGAIEGSGLACVADGGCPAGEECEHGICQAHGSDDASDDGAEAGDDHGSDDASDDGAEAGDDHGDEVEPGDDHGAGEGGAEAGDDGGAGEGGAEAGDDGGAGEGGAEAGDL